MAFDNNRHSSSSTTSVNSWTAPNVWGTAPPKSPTHTSVSSFLGTEYTPSTSPPSSRRPRSLTLRTMNPFSSSSSNSSTSFWGVQQHTTDQPLTHIVEEHNYATSPSSTPRTIQKVYPTLHEVLANSAPAPYTLHSFMAYLSTLHSLESLEYLIDAGRYRTVYNEVFSSSASTESPSSQPSIAEIERVRTTWNRLIDAYVCPGGSREVNLPSDIRDSLLRIQVQHELPTPEMLDASTEHIYNLMRDSVLAGFIANCDTTQQPISHHPTPSLAPAGHVKDPSNRHLWNKSPSGRLNRTTSSGSQTSSRSSSTDLTPLTSGSGGSQPISIPYPVSSQKRAATTNYSRSMGSYHSSNHSQGQMVFEEAHLESWLETPADEMSDVEEGNGVDRHSGSSGRASPMTPPLTPPPQGEGSPVREGGMWGRVIKERLRLRR